MRGEYGITGAAACAHDPLGRLASATRGGAMATYAYTGDGALAATTAGGATTRYTLDTRGGLSERLGATTGGVSTWYVRGWGQELARERGGVGTWLLPDRLGSVRAEVDAAGAVAARYDYEPYGAPEGPATPADYGYAGEPRDGASGLVHLRARWYQPMSGQFTARDPHPGAPPRPQTLAPYAYAHNDPANLTDPTGWFVDGESADAGAGGPAPLDPRGNGLVSAGGLRCAAPPRTNPLLLPYLGATVVVAGVPTLPQLDPAAEAAVAEAMRIIREAQQQGQSLPPNWRAAVVVGGTLVAVTIVAGAYVVAPPPGAGREVPGGAPAVAAPTAPEDRAKAAPQPQPTPVPAPPVARDSNGCSIGGRYGHLKDSSTVGPYKDFTDTQKRQIYAANRQRNNGKLCSDLSGIELVEPVRSQKRCHSSTKRGASGPHLPADYGRHQQLR